VSLLDEYQAFSEKAFGPPRSPAEWDAVTLDRAAEILRSRTTKPGNFWLGVLCRILTSTAAKIRAEASRAAD
jgi:hypothetical protein